MKYINREYGFEGRPPFFKGYFEKKSKGPDESNFRYPQKSCAGFGLEASSPNGVLLAGTLGTVWGARISYQRLGKWVESEDFLSDPGNFFAADKSGKFAYFHHGDIAASIINYSSSKLVMVVSGMTKVKVKIDFYPVLPSNAEIRSEENTVKGVAPERAVVQGAIKLTDTDMIIKDRYEVEFDEGSARKEYFIAKSYISPLSVSQNGNVVSYEYYLDTQTSRIMFFLAVGDSNISENLPSVEELNEGSSKAELLFTAERIAGSGALGENISNAVSNSLWHRVYDPYFFIPLLIEDRRKSHKYFSYDSTEAAQGALIYALMGEYESAHKQLGLCINDKILGALTAWILFCRTRNGSIITDFMPRIAETFTLDGKLVEADKMTLNEIAYKQTDSPFKDISSGAIYSLDMSCYKLITIEILAKMCEISGNKAAEKLRQAQTQLKEEINKTLFNDKLGLYMDRYLTGEFVPLYGFASFLPLTAGAVDDIGRLERLVLNLKDPKKFGGDFMVSSLAKCHPLYGRKVINNAGEEIPPFESYRGMIVPRTNFLIYLGLKRYGVSEIQSQLAYSSARHYGEILKKFGATPDYYIPVKNAIGRNCVENALSGNLMSFIGMTEMLDVEYFREDMRPSLCFGTLIEGNHRLANVELLGHTFSVIISDQETQLFIDGEEVFKGSGSKFIVRHLVEKDGGAEFVIYAGSELTLKIKLPLFLKGSPADFTFNVQKGKYKVVIDKNNQVHPTKLKFNT
ncbi:MAG: hypothetical protein PHC84_01220 [Clostridia bacterium]|nr:hypothetical protein [Clostridia bacterium]